MKIEEVRAIAVSVPLLEVPTAMFKVGGRTVAEDAARVKFAREPVGPQGRLSLDANNAYGSAAEAIEAGRAFERAAGPLGLWWLEEPLSPEDVAGHARVAAALDVPVAPHWHHNLHVHLAAATPNCIVVEHFDVAKDVFNFERLLTPDSRARPEGGFLAVPDRPGLGVEFDVGAVERFRLQ